MHVSNNCLNHLTVFICISGHVLSPTANYTRLIMAVKVITQNMLRELLEHFIQPENLIAELGNRKMKHSLKSGDLNRIYYAKKGYIDFDYNLICRIFLSLFPAFCITGILEQPNIPFEHPIVPQQQLIASLQHEMSQDYNVKRCHDWKQPIDPPQQEQMSIGYIALKCQTVCDAIMERSNVMISSEEFNTFLNEFIFIAKKLEIVLQKQPNEFVYKFEDLRSLRY